MYKEIAVEPACIADSECFFALRDQFGFEKGRYLIADRFAWLKAAMEAVKAAQARDELRPVRARTIKEWLNKLSKQKKNNERQLILTNDRLLGGDDKSWNEWWTEQNAMRAFDVSVMSQSNSPYAYDFTELSSLPNWKISPSYFVERTAEEIVSFLKPLLRMSKDLLLVDNFFNLASNPVLVALIRALSETGGKHLTVATTCDCVSAERVWQREYQHLVPTDFHCDWVKVPDRYFHDRYLISDTGAVKAGHGFSVGVEQGAASDKLSLSYCSYEEASSVRQQVHALVDDGRAKKIWSC